MGLPQYFALCRTYFAPRLVKSADQNQRVVIGTGLRVEQMLGNCDRGLAQHIEVAFQVGSRFQAITKDCKNGTGLNRDPLDPKFLRSRLAGTENHRCRRKKVSVAQMVQMRVDVAGGDAFEDSVTLKVASYADGASARWGQFFVDRNSHRAEIGLCVPTYDVHRQIRRFPRFGAVAESVGDCCYKAPVRWNNDGVVAAKRFARERLAHDCRFAERRGRRFELSRDDASAFHEAIIEVDFVCEPAYGRQARTEGAGIFR
jgi:hypothetical protein